MARRCERSPDTAMVLEMTHVLLDEPRYAVAAGRIDAIARRHLTSAEAHHRLVFERSAARMAFMAATDKGASFAALSKRFRARCALGFDLLFSELAVLVEFAYACGELGEREAGLAVLGQAQERLAGSGLKPHSVFFREHSEFIEQCRQRLEGGEVRPH